MSTHVSIRVPKRLIKAALVLALVGAVITPVAVSASHQFTDVPDTNIFHDSIAWLADNGVTKGCNPPTNDEFCPNDNVTRGQMAAFMQRLAEAKVVDAATAVAADSATDSELLDGQAPSAYQTVVAGAQRDWLVSGPVVVPGLTDTKLVEIEFNVPADGFAAVTGTASFIGFPTGATFGLVAWVQLDSTTCSTSDSLTPTEHVPGTSAFAEFDADVSTSSTAGTGVVPVTAGLHTATLCAANNSGADSSTAQDAGVTVIVSPLGASNTTPPLPVSIPSDDVLSR